MGWIKLCGLADVPAGEMRICRAQDVDMLVVRGADAYLVIPPSCPHMANALSDGFFDGCVLTCNKHLWQWSVADGQPIGQAEQPLLAYETRTQDGEIWVNLEKELVYDHQEEDDFD